MTINILRAPAVIVAFVIACSQLPGAEIDSHDPRFKVDLMVVVAHPDDESVAGAYLAQAVFDQGKRVAVVYGNHGDKGANSVGPERANSLGAIREIEARRALAVLGIDLVWFLDGHDVASSDVLQSLAVWKQGTVLEQLVRLIRLTRPEVILSWLPQYVIGENHGDHQAAGVIATEAFDLAADPTVFPYQVATPRAEGGLGVLEGLRLWQPKKLYFFSDRYSLEAFKNQGPMYPSGTSSPSHNLPYYALAAQSVLNHATQLHEWNFNEDDIRKGNYKPFLDALMRFSGTTNT